MMSFAFSLEALSKCEQRGVAAIIVDSDMTQVYSIGINGGPKGGLNCLCSLGDKYSCVHAEANAIAKDTAYADSKILICTLSPCVTCASLIVNAGIKTVIYADTWKNTDGLSILIRAGLKVIKYEGSASRANCYQCHSGRKESNTTCNTAVIEN